MEEEDEKPRGGVCILCATAVARVRPHTPPIIPALSPGYLGEGGCAAAISGAEKNWRK
jgi:hypothetical protein